MCDNQGFVNVHKMKRAGHFPRFKQKNLHAVLTTSQKFREDFWITCAIQMGKAKQIKQGMILSFSNNAYLQIYRYILWCVARFGTICKV